MSNRLLLAIVSCGLGSFVLAFEPPNVSLPPAKSGTIEFDRDVQPILMTHCATCHISKEKGGLSLKSRERALVGGDSGRVIVDRDSAKSKLIHVVAAKNSNDVMPPGDAKKLTDNEIGILRAWVDQGTVWNGTFDTRPDSRTNHWAFQPIQRPNTPEHLNTIDYLVQKRLVKEGLTASPRADRTTLIRRLSFDIIGLPPTPQEIDAFLNDRTASALETLVDRLLDSPHFGERWGRHWLDLARYADSDGYEKDSPRPFAWRYRDWVIQALNADLPFDRFTIEQLAGDLLPNATIEQKTATGFHRNTLTNKEGGVDQEEFRVAAVVDRVNTTGTTWLGLTVGCAQCHDHKYDPLSQREYYQLFAYFNSDRETDVVAPLPAEAEQYAQKRVQTANDRQILVAAIDEAKAKNLSTSELVKREQALIAFDKKQLPVSKVQTITLGTHRPTYVLLRGDFLRKGVEVQANTPSVLPKSTRSTNRLDLANWLISQENPLTPRVISNWVWSKLFGRGLVSTLEDFGTQGQPPSHPELLDWLANEFRGSLRWSMKQLIKTIVLSDTYLQSSIHRSELIERDPLNVLLARQARLRLESELVRDAALASAGLLNRSIGGPSIRPPQPPGVSELTYANSAKWVTTTGPDRYKRGLYIWFQRTSPYPMLMTFDNPDSNVCVVRRERSNSPLQALTTLNDTVFVEAAQAFAKRVLTEEQSFDERLTLAMRLTLGRPASSTERTRLKQLYSELYKITLADEQSAAKLVGTATTSSAVPSAESAAWVGLCRTLLNLDEFVTRE